MQNYVLCFLAVRFLLLARYFVSICARCYRKTYSTNPRPVGALARGPFECPKRRGHRRKSRESDRFRLYISKGRPWWEGAEDLLRGAPVFFLTPSYRSGPTKDCLESTGVLMNVL